MSVGSAIATDRPAAEKRLLTGWGRTAPTLAQVEHPRAADELAASLAAADRDRGAIPRGLGRAYGDAAQNAGGTVLTMTGLTGVHRLDLEAAEIEVDAGISLEALIALLLPFGLFISVSPGTRYVTVGGAIAADIHGKNHHREGSFCEHVVAFTLITPSGEAIEARPEENPDVFWVTAGGMGLTGVVVRATLRLLRVETSRMRVDTERTTDLDEVLARMTASDEDYRYSVAWIDCLALSLIHI